MTDFLASAYFIAGLFVAGAFVGEAARDKTDRPDAADFLFMLVVGALFWPATLGVRFGRRWLP